MLCVGHKPEPRNQRDANTMTDSSWKDLPEDVVIDILSRLTVKTLIRLRCVCKSWYATITHPCFISTHLNRASSCREGYLQFIQLESSERSIQLVCDLKSVNEERLEIPIQSNFALESVGTMDGLICLSDYM
ncbi:hypothetical protein L1049_019767 [Liquidambar formosana]|uniref:F-box domain-containing protein n=1 Tax=Liquidambar formosana TaxID=63359 RepID=A0AAP0X6S3_LIQFO